MIIIYQYSMLDSAHNFVLVSTLMETFINIDTFIIKTILFPSLFMAFRPDLV